MTMKKVYIATFPKIDGSFEYRIALSDDISIHNCFVGDLDDQDRGRQEIFGNSNYYSYSDMNTARRASHLYYSKYHSMELEPFDRPILRTARLSKSALMDTIIDAECEASSNSDLTYSPELGLLPSLDLLEKEATRLKSEIQDLQKTLDKYNEINSLKKERAELQNKLRALQG